MTDEIAIWCDICGRNDDAPHTPIDHPWLIKGHRLIARPLVDKMVAAARLEAIDACIAIVQQSLDTVRSEDDGESRLIKTSIYAREHIIALLVAYREKS